MQVIATSFPEVKPLAFSARCRRPASWRTWKTPRCTDRSDAEFADGCSGLPPRHGSTRSWSSLMN